MANFAVKIGATAKLVGDIAAKVAKTFRINTSDGITGGGTLDSDLTLALDMDYIRDNLGDTGGDTYTFTGDDYISVSVEPA